MKIGKRITVDADGCWIWTGGTSCGYGQFRLDGRDVDPRRILWRLANGPIPRGRSLFRRPDACGKQLCVRPDHWYLGTVDDIRPQGESHHHAKLTAKQVREIRRRREQGEEEPALAAEYGVHISQISRVGNRKSWKHA